MLPLMPALCIHALQGEVSVIRRTTTIEKGFPVETEAAPEVIEAVIHPASGRMVQRLPQGLQCMGGVVVYTAAEVRCERDCDSPDVIVYQPGKDSAPKRYVAYESQDWSAQSDARHVRVLAYAEPRE